jgi:hypothetical protein
MAKAIKLIHLASNALPQNNRADKKRKSDARCRKGHIWDQDRLS